MKRLLGIDEIIIERVTGGIPVIKAKNETDLYFGLGYCHGLDRGMQLMFMKILGKGTASEHLANTDDMLEIDKFFRRMNWGNNVSDEIGKLSKSESKLLQSYCDGVNAAFKKQKPWELRYLLGFKNFQWTKEDCILIFRMSGYLTFAQSQAEIERLFVQMVQKGVSKEMLDELFPDILGDYDESILKQIKLGEKIVPDAVKWNAGLAPLIASNNWAISGSKTKSGSPILANDPHMEINRLPSIWYEVATQLNGNYTHGATLPGGPPFIIGRNNEFAWSITYAFMDASDSWVEKCKDGRYLKDGKWHNFIERRETVKRKKANPVDITFYENEHGVLDGNPYEEGYYLCSKWSGDKLGASSIKSAINLASAKNVKEGMSCAGNIEMSLSWIFADSQGNIGFQMSGLMPKRKDGESGFSPLIGWKSENDWQGFHAAEDLPRSFNPEEGFIVTANNDLNNLGVIHPITICMGAYRAERIKQLIESKKNHGIDDTKKMQYDTYSLQAEQFMEIIKPLLPDTDKGKLLREWDLHYDIDSKGAFLFEMIYRGLLHEVFGSVIGKGITDFLQNETGIFIDFYQNFDQILLAKNSIWFKGKQRNEIYKKVIDVALKGEVKAWGEINNIRLDHILLGGKLPKFMGFDKGPFPLPGGRATIHQGQVYKSAGRTTSFAPSFRLVTDMSEYKLYTNYVGGVSDRRFSGLYSNDFSNWMNGIYKEFTF